MTKIPSELIAASIKAMNETHLVGSGMTIPLYQMSGMKTKDELTERVLVGLSSHMVHPLARVMLDGAAMRIKKDELTMHTVMEYTAETYVVSPSNYKVLCQLIEHLALEDNHDIQMDLRG